MMPSSADGVHESGRIVLRHDVQRRLPPIRVRDQDDGEADDMRHRQYAIDAIAGHGPAQDARDPRGERAGCDG